MVPACVLVRPSRSTAAPRIIRAKPKFALLVRRSHALLAMAKTAAGRLNARMALAGVPLQLLLPPLLLRQHLLLAVAKLETPAWRTVRAAAAIARLRERMRIICVLKPAAERWLCETGTAATGVWDGGM